MNGYGLGALGYADPRMCSREGMGSVIDETSGWGLGELAEVDADAVSEHELAALIETYPEFAETEEGLGFLKKIGKLIKRNTSSILRVAGAVAPVFGPVGVVAGMVAQGVANQRDSSRAEKDAINQQKAQEAAQRKAAQAAAAAQTVRPAGGGTFNFAGGSTSAPQGGGTSAPARSATPWLIGAGVVAVGALAFAMSRGGSRR